MKYRAGYKCRICGRTSLRGEVLDETPEGMKKRLLRNMAEVISGRATIKHYAAGIYPSPVKICICENGEIGISDFIGYKQADEADRMKEET